MEPPPLVMMPSKVVGGEEASTAHLWDMWSFGSLSRRIGPENFMARIVSLLTRG
jgi:hypothetical protein